VQVTSPIHVPQDGALLLLDRIHVIRRKDKSLGSGQVVVSWVPGTFNTSGRNKRLEAVVAGGNLNMATGQSTVANGNLNTATGLGAIATGDRNVALGNAAIAQGQG
jgi:hypothetical protein